MHGDGQKNFELNRSMSASDILFLFVRISPFQTYFNLSKLRQSLFRRKFTVVFFLSLLSCLLLFLPFSVCLWQLSSSFSLTPSFFHFPPWNLIGTPFYSFGARKFQTNKKSMDFISAKQRRLAVPVKFLTPTLQKCLV